MHIDGWTLALQAVNLLVLLALLRWLFYRPLLGVINARRGAIEAELAKGKAAVAAADRRGQALAEERARFEASLEQTMSSGREAIEREREAALDEARRQAEAALADARRQVERERRDAAQALFDEAATLATRLAARLLEQAAPARHDPDFIGALLARVEATAASERADWFAPDAPRVLSLASAHVLDDAMRARAKAGLLAALGADASIDFVVDTALIAGAELRFPHGVLALNWAAELAKARELMLSEKEPAP